MFELFFIAFCLLLNALLSGSETAFIAVNRSTLRELERKGDSRASLLLKLRANPERTLSIVQLGITFVGALAAAVGGAGAEEIITPWLVQHLNIKESIAEIISVLIVVLPLTYISVVLGELVPKTFALRRPFYFAAHAAPWLNWLNSLLSPLITVFEWSTKKIIGLFPKRHSVPENTEENASAIELDVLPPVNREYVLNILKIEKTTVGQISVNWSEVIAVDWTDRLSHVEETIVSSGHTRIPVLKGNEVEGIINAKEFLAFQKTDRQDWHTLVRPAIKMSHRVPILSALQRMQEKRAHMAIVYQGLQKQGIITMEAIFEEIIGDIYDEDDDGTIDRLLRFRKIK